MTLLEVQTVIPHPINKVFALTVNLERAPRWHAIFTGVQQLTANPIGIGSQWKIHYRIGSFVLEITEYQPPQHVTFKGSPVIGGTIPHFTIALQVVPAGTHLMYRVQPEIPRWLKPLMLHIAPPYGKRDLERYFRELNKMLEA